MSNNRPESEFWHEHWWKLLLFVLVIAAAGLTVWGTGGYREALHREQSACWEQGGQIFENLCVSSPVKEASP